MSRVKLDMFGSVVEYKPLQGTEINTKKLKKGQKAKTETKNDAVF